MTRTQLQRLFVIGHSLWNHRSEFTKRLGAEIMDMVEGEIGQQSARPERSRRTEENQDGP